MKENTFLQQLLNRYSNLKHQEDAINNAVDLITGTFKNGGKLLVCGNGGSCSDADHIVGELMKSFEGHRPLNSELQQKLGDISYERGTRLARELQQGLPAISLTAHNALITAIANDIDGDMIYAQQVTGLGQKGDVLLGLSTSGNSQNVIDALIVARAKGLKTIAMTGDSGGQMRKFCDVLINVPEKRTAYVQELHLPVYHTICMMIENELFNNH
uniref:D-sedoheptulose-7-phosphate isomerase n=1 Tax=uncultured Draconibacterium sp. TaxID=1573823 RepID=UPI003216AAB3